MAQLIRDWVMSCKQWIRESRIDRSLTPPAKPQWTHYCARRCHANWFGAGITAIGWLHKYCDSHGCVFPLFFRVPTSNQDAKTIAKVLIIIMTKHAYLPTTLISDKSTAFMSHVIKGVAGVLSITLKHATTKHAQTIGLLEQSHALIKQALKTEIGEWRSLWHKYVNFAALNYNTSYHTSIGCEPSRVFHSRIPYNVLDLKLGVAHSSSPFLPRK